MPLQRSPADDGWIHFKHFDLRVVKRRKRRAPAVWSLVRVSSRALLSALDGKRFEKDSCPRFHPALAMSQKCLVTGAAGRIGSRLLERGCFVLGVELTAPASRVT